MESVGARLRHTRESHGYTVEQVARDTHIAKRFIEALENEDFSVFPGDPYLIGFMRTYSDYLGLNAQETVQLYQNMQLQEQPPPIEELISSGPRLPLGRILLVVLALAVVAGAVYLAISGGLFDGGGTPPVAADPAPAPSGRLYEMTDEIIEQRFALGDRIVVPVAEERFTLEIVGIDRNLTVRFGDEERSIASEQEAVFDLTQDGRADVRVVVRRLETQDSPPTVVARIDRGAGTVTATVLDDGAVQEQDIPDLGTTSEPTRQAQARLITQAAARGPFAVQVSFVGNTLFRYESDSQPRVEQYFQTGQSISATAQNRFKVWVSNAASVRLRVADQDVSLGGPGQVTAALITWVPGETGSSQLLQIFPVY